MACKVLLKAGYSTGTESGEVPRGKGDKGAVRLCLFMDVLLVLEERLQQSQQNLLVPPFV